MNKTAVDEMGIPSGVLYNFYHLIFNLISGDRNAPLDLNTHDNYNYTDQSKFTHATSYLHSVMGLSSFVYAFVGPGDQNSTWNVMQMGQAGLSLPSRDYYLNKDADDPTILALQNNIITLLDLYNRDTGTTIDETSIDRANAIITFETQLANIFLSRTDMRDPNAIYNVLNVESELNQNGASAILKSYGYADPNAIYNVLNVESELNQNGASALDYHEFFERILCGPHHHHPNHTNDDSGPPYDESSHDHPSCFIPETVIVPSPQYLLSLDELLRTTSAGTLLDFLQWKALSAFSSHLSTEYQNANFQFRKVVYGIKTQSPRWKKCVGLSDGVLGYALGSMFAHETFSEDSKEVAETMIDDITQAFNTNLEDIDWMDDDTRQAAKEKANAVTRKIGYPTNLYHDDDLNAYYQYLEINRHDYIDNIRHSQLFDIRNNYNDFNTLVDKSEWEMTPPTVNAYYNPPNNEIVFPAGILQPPFYNQAYPSSMNYGGIGVVIGHELTHGFDDQGSQYDLYGNLNPWWTPSVEEAFEDQTRCISEQYSAYQVDGTNVNGNLTLGENIADNGGLRNSYAAYKTASTSKQQTLPGLDHLTSNQLFFVGFATVWCGSSRPEEAQRLLLTDPHSPGNYRVIGTVSNSDDFAREFQCPVGSPMNPEQKCRVW
eukprot:CAMPEP_0194398194 /NCGR_PEP_ID=MMETSP0174-20130528/125967_1 /TAXON_ID=216777 /ORGANISM="Proboscia alata, Strain PI-D3" /LENGTH=659 /DNA_ID=CAMNT_0039194465 /DNA_START=3057 /DNA_END=5034 /DNA_ORIENTATION=+